MISGKVGHLATTQKESIPLHLHAGPPRRALRMSAGLRLMRNVNRRVVKGYSRDNGLELLQYFGVMLHKVSLDLSIA